MAHRPVALVTGVSSGIGFEVASLLAARGYRTFGTSRSLEGNKGPTGVEMLRLDVTSDESASAADNDIISRIGRVDVLVNNAGFGLFGAVEETSLDEAKAQLETNFGGVVRMTARVLPRMRERSSGRIINISSVLGFMAIPFHAFYVASKHALEGYSEALSLELRPFGIHVVLIEPGYTRSLYFDHSRETKSRLGAYASERNRVVSSMAERIRGGSDPKTIAQVVLGAITTGNPSLRYTAGVSGGVLKVGRSLLPTSLFDRAVRKAFALN